MKIAKAIILTEGDIKEYQPTCGCGVDVLIIPETMKDEFLKSKAYKALMPCLSLSELEQKILTYKVWKPTEKSVEKPKETLIKNLKDWVLDV